MLALLCARLCLCTRKGEKLSISKFLLRYQVMSCYSVEVKRGRYRAKERREVIVEQGLNFRLPTAPGISRILRGVI